jgi:hypothetical protein
MASSSIYGSQVQSAAQSLAAYLQALQAKNNGTPAGTAGNDISTTNTVVNGTGSDTKSPTAKNSAPSGSQATDTVTLSAEAQLILANAQAPSNGPGSLATYLNTSNSQDGLGQVNGVNSDPLSSGYQGAIAQFKQWLSTPLGQPVPNIPGEQTDNSTQKTSDSAANSGVGATSSTSS